MLFAPETIPAAIPHDLERHMPAMATQRAGGDTPDPRLAIRRYILENFLFSNDPSAIADDASFLQQGIIDSVGALEIALFLEQHFGFAVREDEMLPKNLDSVNNLVAFVERRQQEV